MSGANAISGITDRRSHHRRRPRPTARWPIVLGFLAVAFATINVVGGFLVTDRMLEMFKKKPVAQDVTQLLYLGSPVLFILGLKQLGSPRTARRGNQPRRGRHAARHRHRLLRDRRDPQQ